MRSSSNAEAEASAPNFDYFAQEIQVYFEFVPDYLSDLSKRHALQYSFLLVHEWLWDYTEDITVNRKVDYLLHSTLLEVLSGPELEANVKSLGLGSP